VGVGGDGEGGGEGSLARRGLVAAFLLEVATSFHEEDSAWSAAPEAKAVGWSMSFS